MARTIAARPDLRLRGAVPRGAVRTARRRAGAALATTWRRRGVRIALICALVALPLLGGGWMWLRSSSLVAVQHVRVVGASGPEAGAIRAALEESAKGMSTLNVSTARLRAAVAPFRVVSDVRVYPSFPHSLRIVVVEQPPVAALTADGTRTAVAADGMVLGQALLSSTLPAVAAQGAPAQGERVSGAQVQAELTVLGAAPPALLRFVQGASVGPRGLTLTMRDGLLVYFGDSTRPHAKWVALVRVLADSTSKGASYVDVRVPERPAAGFPEGVAPEGTPAAAAAAAGGPAPTPGASSESTIAQLAAGLEAGGGTSAAAAPSETKKEEEAKSSEAQNGEAKATESAASGGGQEAEPSG